MEKNVGRTLFAVAVLAFWVGMIALIGGFSCFIYGMMDDEFFAFVGVVIMASAMLLLLFSVLLEALGQLVTDVHEINGKIPSQTASAARSYATPQPSTQPQSLTPKPIAEQKISAQQKAVASERIEDLPDL